MNINQLESFKLSDAIKFHDKLNPKLFVNNKPRPEVKKQLLVIAKDFISELGIKDLAVDDITISGSNAAYTYTDHSDLDLHILVDFKKLPNDEVYQELFNAKKTIYNDTHDIKVHGVPVELYVQDSNQPVISLGEYSLLQNKWLRIPVKRRANLDQTITKQKYNKLYELVQIALKSKKIKKIEELLKTMRRYRQAGLDKGGEFSPENLAYKALRSQGWLTKLYNLKDKLHSQSLSIEGMYEQLDVKTMSPEQLAKHHGVSVKHILAQLDKGIKVELEHTSDKKVAKEIALDHLKEDPNYYTKLLKANLEESSKRYAPYFIKESLSDQEKYLNSINGTVPMETWLIFLEEMLGNTHLLESVDQDILSQVKNLEKLGVKNPIIGKKYIPIPILVIKNQIHIMNILGQDNLQTPAQFLTLAALTDSTYVFKFKNRTMEYPYGKNHKSVYSTVLVVDDESMYDKISMLIELYFDTKLPSIQNNDLTESSRYIPFEKEKYESKNQLQEGISPIVYHYTRAFYAKKILASGEFQLSSTLGSVEEQYAPKGYPYFLSTTRSRRGGYHDTIGSDAVLFVLDGTWYSRHYKAAPVDYWQNRDPLKSHHRPHEAEDRIFSKEPSMSIQGVKEIHIYVSPKAEEKTKAWARQDLILAKQRGIKTYFYTNEQAWRNQDKRKLGNLSVLTGQERTGGYISTHKGYLLPWIEVIKAKDKKQLSLDANKLRYSLQFSGDKKSMAQGLANDLSNARKPDSGPDREHAVNIIRYMRANKLNNVMDLVNNLSDKWKSVEKVDESASGYIPSEKEKNDPRFKTALTVDVKPDTMRKDAKKFGNKISRAGIPPTLRADGKF